MVTFRPFKTAVMYGSETSYGAGATANTAIKAKVQEVTINKVNNIIRLNGLGETRNDVFTGFGNFEVTWSMNMELAGFEFFQYCIGNISGSGTTAAPYLLTESEYQGYTAGLIPSFALAVASEEGATDDMDTVSGCIINSASFELALGSTLKATCSGFGRTVTSSTTATAFTPDTTKPWIFAQGNFKWNGSAVARVTRATISMDFNYNTEVGRQIGSRFVEAAEPGVRKYNWTIDVKMTDTVATTLRDHFYGQANSPSTGIASAEPTMYALILDLSEGATTGLRNAQILLSNCSINEISKPIRLGENIVGLTINGSGKTGTSNVPIKWWTVSP